MIGLEAAAQIRFEGSLRVSTSFKLFPINKWGCCATRGASSRSRSDATSGGLSSGWPLARGLSVNQFAAPNKYANLSPGSRRIESTTDIPFRLALLNSSSSSVRFNNDNDTDSSSSSSNSNNNNTNDDDDSQQTPSGPLEG